MNIESGAYKRLIGLMKERLLVSDDSTSVRTGANAEHVWTAIATESLRSQTRSDLDNCSAIFYQRCCLA
jgi:hypothetical protein